MNWEQALKHCIFRFVSGSHAYGTNTPESDMDYRGVFIAPISYGFELFQTSQTAGSIKDRLVSALRFVKEGFFEDTIHQIESAMAVDGGDLSFGVATVKPPKIEEKDEELHELRKFLKLCGKNNPNIIEFLWVEKLVEIEKPVWTLIKKHRDLFLSKNICHTFAGYAHAQLHKIQTHRGYILNGPRTKPTRAEYGLPEHSKICPEHQNAIYSLPEEWVRDDSKELVMKEKKYSRALKDYKSYLEWEETRNPARRELERKYGYDTKHAMHLVRLSRMAEEILTGKGVLVHRPDAVELNEIRNGKWSYEDVLKVADNLDERLKPLYKASTLPKTPNYSKISALYKEICERVYKIKLTSDQEEDINNAFKEDENAKSNSPVEKA